MIELRAIYILWLREMIKFSRSKERIIGSIAMPLMFLAFLGMGFSKTAIPGFSKNTDYIHFLVPGIIGMNMLFSSMFGGLSVLWDREFGFLKEIMVAPVSRVSIALGRIAGGATTGLIQGILLFAISFVFGFTLQPFPLYVPVLRILGMLLFMVFIALIFLSLGLSFAVNMRDAEGFQLIMNFVIFPLFFLSGSISPIQNLPIFIRIFSYMDPLTYAIDGMRSVLIKSSMFPVSFDLLVCIIISLLMVALASYFFERSDSV